MKTVLFVLDSYHIGGVSTFVKQYADALLSANHKAVLVGGSSNMSDYQQYFSGCQIYTAGRGPGFGILDKIRRTKKYFTTLSRISREQNIDLVHLTTTWSAVILLTHPAFWGIPKVMTFFGAHHLERDSMMAETKGSFSLEHYVKQWLRKYIQSIVLRRSARVITFSVYAQGLLDKEFNLKKHVHVIPGYVKVPRKKSTKKIPDSQLRLVNIGRAEPRKGVTLLFGMMKQLEKKKIHALLKISSPVGFYYADHFLEKYESENLFDRVHILHGSNSQQKRSLLEEADLFVIPSLDLETFGMTVIEALALGVPVVVTPAGALPEIIEPICSSFIAKNISAEALADVVAWFVSLPDEQKNAFMIKSVAHVRQNYSLAKVREKLLDVYAQAARQNTRLF